MIDWIHVDKWTDDFNNCIKQREAERQIPSIITEEERVNKLLSEYV